jgi:signal transduction histidine kinase/ligand-binding sensor domain-containing protein
MTWNRMRCALWWIPLSIFADSSLSLRQYHHSNWRAEDDQIPLGSVSAIAQTAEGYLVVGNGSRLFRFDGVRFSAIVPAWTGSARIQAILGSRDGRLWIGSRAGLHVLESGAWRAVTTANARPIAAVTNLVEDESGAVWAAVWEGKSAALLQIHRNGVERLEAPPWPIKSLQRALGGGVWIGGTKELCLWRKTSVAMNCQASPGPVDAIATETGQVAVLSSRQIYAGSPDDFASLRKLPEAPPGTILLLAGRQDTFWLGTFGSGLARLRLGQIETYGRNEGLSGDLVQALFEDREGNVWVGTSGGLDRFRRPRLERFTTREGLSADLISAVAVAADGTVWAGGSNGLNRIQGSSIQSFQSKDGLPSNTVIALHASNRLWAGTTGGLVSWQDGRFVNPLPAGAKEPQPFTITESKDGKLWLNDGGRRLQYLQEKPPQLVTLALPDPSRNIYRLAPGADGGLWIGYFDGKLAKLDRSGRYQDIPPDRNIAGPPRALFEDRDGVLWGGSESGLWRYQSGKWTAWGSKYGVPEGGVHGLLEDAAGGLYVVGLRLVKYFRASTRQALQAEKPLVADRELPLDETYVDMDARATGPRMALGPDGKLWIGSDQGLLAAPPLESLVPRVPPSVVIEEAIDGQQVYRPTPSERLRFKGSQLVFQYTALSLTNPERTRFRYRLEGFRPDWVEANRRRDATYTNLSPGDYRFCVSAAHATGDWNAQPACQSFEVIPLFYQTKTFLALAVGSVLLLLWGAYYLRMQSYRNRFKLVLQERLRIARELHDSPLQSFAGISFLLEAASRQIETAPALSKQRIEKAMNQADLAAAQARQAILMLRLSELDDGLTTAISATGKRLAEEKGIRFQMTADGPLHLLSDDAERTLYMIACEAIQNAVKHARPSSIRIAIGGDKKGMTMVVEDDGSGFDSSVEVSHGHWGLRGMGERVKSIGLVLQVKSAPGQGTRVEVSIPPSHLRKAQVW